MTPQHLPNFSAATKTINNSLQSPWFSWCVGVPFGILSCTAAYLLKEYYPRHLEPQVVTEPHREQPPYRKDSPSSEQPAFVRKPVIDLREAKLPRAI